MIKNERQYRITKAQASAFAESLRELEERPSPLHPVLHKAQIDAVRSQHADLQSTIEQYELLQQKRPAAIETESLEELPRALISARIALGLSQKDLAEKMGLKEQQLQRYESTEYSAASLSRIREVADALGVRISERVFLPMHEPTREALYDRLDAAGIDSNFLLARLLPPEISMGLESSRVEEQEQSVARAASVLERIYQWGPEELCGTAPLRFASAAIATARFKVPGGAPGRRLQAYIVYAHYIAMVVANACRTLPLKEATITPSELRRRLISKSPTIDLASVVNLFWDAGIPVVPLNDAGAFHGACWRIDGRNVIVVKHRSKYLSRWVFDLLHEWHHAAQDPTNLVHSWIEDSDITSTRRTSPEEQAANNFAGNVLLNERAEKLVEQCVQLSGGSIPKLKSAVQRIAEKNGVVVDHLANYLAWRLSLQGENWWGTSNNLQSQCGDPFAVVSEIFYKRFDFTKIDPIDSLLLSRALEHEGMSK